MWQYVAAFQERKKNTVKINSLSSIRTVWTVPLWRKYCDSIFYCWSVWSLWLLGKDILNYIGHIYLFLIYFWKYWGNQYMSKHIGTKIDTEERTNIQCTISIDAGPRQVVDCFFFFQHSTSTPELFLPCTRGTRTVGLPQAWSSPHHPSSCVAEMWKKKAWVCSNSSYLHS